MTCGQAKSLTIPVVFLLPQQGLQPAEQFPHDHQNSILSGVYYVDCEGDDVGNFVAERDDTAEFFLGSYKNVSGFTGTSFAITPLTGFAFLMPSWVLHSVEQNLTDRDRISIAFNFVNPDVVPNNSYD